MNASHYDMDGLVARLTAMSDAEYRDFNLTTMPGVDLPSLGVRLPQLRSLGKEILKGDWRGFLEASREYPLFEARMLHAIVLGGAKCPVDEKLSLVDAFLPHIHDWGECDTLCTSFKPRPADRDAVFAFCRDCAMTDVEFRKRFGLVMLMSHFHYDPYADGTMAVYRAFSHPGYYARMGAAWGLATLWLYRREAALQILTDGLWDDFTHNKAIQKLRESYRVSDEDKALVLALRRNTRRKGGDRA